VDSGLRAGNAEFDCNQACRFYPFSCVEAWEG